MSNSQPGAQGVSSVSHGASSVERTELPSDIFIHDSVNESQSDGEVGDEDCNSS